MIELLCLIGMFGPAAAMTASSKNDSDKKEKADAQKYLSMMAKTHSRTNSWEDPVTGDYRKHRLDIDID